jgi:1-acyl-sn-glycerol-3-phosphate acyltransferase
MWYLLAPFRLLYKLYFGIIFMVIGIITYPFFIALVGDKKNNNRIFFLQKYIYVGFLQIFGLIWVKTIGAEKLPKKPSVIVANHTSFFDIVCSYRAFQNHRFSFLAKYEIKKMPIVKLFFRNENMNITVERGNKSDGAAAIQKMGIKIDEGYHAIIYPEGTRSKFAPKMRDFRAGAFRLAIEKQVPIVPVTYLDNWQVLGDLGKLWGWARPGITRVVIHDPIETKGMTEEDLLPLVQRVRTIIENEMKKAHPKYYKVS